MPDLGTQPQLLDLEMRRLAAHKARHTDWGAVGELPALVIRRRWGLNSKGRIYRGKSNACLKAKRGESPIVLLCISETIPSLGGQLPGGTHDESDRLHGETFRGLQRYHNRQQKCRSLPASCEGKRPIRPLTSSSTHGTFKHQACYIFLPFVYRIPPFDGSRGRNWIQTKQGKYEQIRRVLLLNICHQIPVWIKIDRQLLTNPLILLCNFFPNKMQV